MPICIICGEVARGEVERLEWPGWATRLLTLKTREYLTRSVLNLTQSVALMSRTEWWSYRLRLFRISEP